MAPWHGCLQQTAKQLAHIRIKHAPSTSYGREQTSRCTAVAQDTRTLLPAELASAQDSTVDAVVIIGAGIAGLATAAALRKVGIAAVVLEQSAKPREEGGAIALWPNAFRALNALGVAEPLRKAHPLLQSVELVSSTGKRLRRFSLDECHGAPHEFRGVARAELLSVLRAAVPADVIRYNCPVSAVTPLEDGAEVRLEDGRSLKARVVLGADGARSKVAPVMQLPTPNYAGYSAYRGVADIGSGQPPTPPDTVRQLFGEGVRAGLYPLSSKLWYWFICWNCPPESVSSEGEERKEHALSLMQSWAEDTGVHHVLRCTPADQITRSRIVDRWRMPGMGTSSSLITVAGDAAHPMTPNLGQGGCCAAEDAIIFARELQTAVQSSNGGATSRSLVAAPTKAIADALRRYEKERSARVLPITIRSHVMGSLLQIPLPLVCNVRNAVISRLLPISNFMEHTLYDCGHL